MLNDEQLHDIVKKSAEKMTADYDPAHWEQMSSMLNSTLPVATQVSFWSKFTTWMGSSSAKIILTAVTSGSIGFFTADRLAVKDIPYQASYLLNNIKSINVKKLNATEDPTENFEQLGFEETKNQSNRVDSENINNEVSNMADSLPVLFEKIEVKDLNISLEDLDDGQLSTSTIADNKPLLMPTPFELRKEEILDLIQKDRIKREDSITYKVLERHKSTWNNVVIVCDWSSSMYKYGTQVITWLKRYKEVKSIKGFVFFNDCTSEGIPLSLDPNAEGGMYVTNSQQIDSISNKMLEAAKNGMKNVDIEENDIEALYSAQKQFPNAEEFILIADNISPVRYSKFMKTIRKPVHIILCGNTLYEDVAIQPHYLKLAKFTKGSLHTEYSDIENIRTIEEGMWLQVDKLLYQYENGGFVFKGKQ